MPSKLVDCVIHVAGEQGSSMPMNSYIDKNVRVTENVVRWCERNSVKRMIYTSSYVVYGEVDGELTESAPRVNPDIYGMTKYIGECIIKNSCIPQKLVLRLPRIFSPYQPMNRHATGLGEAVYRFFHNETVYCNAPNVPYNMYMCGNALSDFVSLQLSHDMPEYDIVNLGATEQHRLIDIMSAIKEGMGSNSELICKEDGVAPRCSNVNLEKAMSLGLVKRNELEEIKSFAKKLKELNSSHS